MPLKVPRIIRGSIHLELEFKLSATAAADLEDLSVDDVILHTRKNGKPHEVSLMAGQGFAAMDTFFNNLIKEKIDEMAEELS